MSAKIKIAATGFDGLVGSRIQELLTDEFQFIPLPQNEMDITNREVVFKVLNGIDYDILFHLAAYTSVDSAEANPELAYKVNVEGTRNVFEAAKNRNKKFVYISTDFVFDGQNPPFFEDSLPNPLSIYGKTKLEGERIISGYGMVVRISYPYRAYYELKKDIVNSIITLLRQREKIKAVEDQLMTFTFIDDIAYALKYLFNHFSAEIFHIVGSESISAYEAMLEICQVFNFNKSLILKTTYDEFYKGKAPRPKKGVIKSKKNNFSPMKTLIEGLQEIKTQIA